MATMTTEEAQRVLQQMAVAKKQLEERKTSDPVTIKLTQNALSNVHQKAVDAQANKASAPAGAFDENGHAVMKLPSATYAQSQAEKRRYEQKDIAQQAMLDVYKSLPQKRAQTAQEELDKFIKEHPGSEYYDPSDGGAYRKRKELEQKAKEARRAAEEENSSQQAENAPTTEHVRMQYQEAERALAEYKRNSPIPVIGGLGPDQGNPNTESEQYKKTVELESKAASLKRQLESMEDQQIMDTDISEIDQLPPEARKHLEALTNFDSVGSYVGAYSGGEVNTDYLLEKAQAQQNAREALKAMGYSTEQIKEWVSSLSRFNNARDAESMKKGTEELADSGFWGTIAGNVTSLATNAAAGPTGALESMLQVINRHTGAGDTRYHTTDANLPGYAAGMFTEGIRGATSENIRESGGAGAVLDVGYKAVMGAADNLIRVGMGGGGKVIPMGLAATGSFQSSYREATARGVPPEKALLLGTANAAVDALTEKLPLDELLDDKTPVKTFGQMLLKAARQGGSEVAEEEIGFVANLMLEAAILGKNAETAADIQDMVASGMSYREAKKAAYGQLMNQALETGIQSFVSGAGMSLGHNLMTGNVPWNQVEPETEALVETPAPENAAPDPSVVADVMEAVMRGEDTAPAKTGEAAITEALAAMEKGPLSNNMATRILENPDAVAILRDLFGLELNGTKAENRNAVKAAMEQMHQNGLDSQAQPQSPKTPAQEQLDRAVQATINGTQIDNAPVPAESTDTNQTQPDRMSMSEEDFIDSMGRDAANSDPFADRSWHEVGKRSEKAFMSQNPAVKPLFQQEAAMLYSELSDTISGERNFNADVYYESGGEKGWSGNKRVASKSIAELLDNGFSRDQIEKGLLSIMEDHGAENNAAAKRIEFIINDRLLNGYTSFYDGSRVPPNSDYVSFANGQSPLNSKALSAEQAQMVNIMSSNILSDARKNNIPLADFYASTERIDAFNPTGTDAELIARSLEPIVQKLDNPNYNSYLEKIRSFSVQHESTQTVDTKNAPTESGNTVPNAPSGAKPAMGAADQGQNFSEGPVKQSKTFTNSGINNADENIAGAYRETLANNPEAAEYRVQTHDDTQRMADARTDTPEKMAAEKQNILNADHWTADDNIVADKIAREAFRGEDADAKKTFLDTALKKKAMNLEAARLIESNKMTMRAAESTEKATVTAIHGIEDLTQETSTFKQKNGGPDFATWKRQTQEAITGLGMAVEQVQDGDTAAMRDAITQIARHRKTTAWFGFSDRLTSTSARILNKLDFETLKTVANCQLASIADDYRARSTGEIMGGIRKNSMLTSLAAFVRNISGNGSGGIMDAMSDSGAGQLMDYVMSKATGKRTVGNDFTHAKAYIDGAKDATSWASLCVELNIPVETDAASSWESAMEGARDGKYMGKTFRADGNIAMRAMYAYQKYMAYNLDVTDKIFEGGTKSAVGESLASLKNANLTDAEADALSQAAANRRTFKDVTWTKEGKDGKQETHGSDLSRATVALKNGAGKYLRAPGEFAADVAIPFASVPMNVAQTGIDYTVGVGKAIPEIISIMQDAKAGKTIDPVRQRQAASDFGRGVTGAGMIALFAGAAAKGIIMVHNDKDKDKRALEQSENLQGAQFNMSALGRMINGEDTAYQDGDHVISMDFLEPFNTQMYLGYELSQAESFKDIAAAPGMAIVQSVLDSPMMQGISDLVEITSDAFSEGSAEDVGDELIKYAGNYVGSYIPQILRQTAQYTDGYYRDTTGATVAETVGNQLKASIPGLSETLPVKYNGLGEAQERPGFNSTFWNPTKPNDVKLNAVAQKLDSLSGMEGGLAIYPESYAPKGFSYKDENGEKHDVLISGKEMTENYQKTYGDTINATYTALMDAEGFNDLPAELQINAFKKAKAYATDKAKAAVSDFAGADDMEPEELASQIVRSTLESYTGLSGENYDDATAAGYSFDQMKQISSVSKGISGYFRDLAAGWKNGGADIDPEQIDAAYEQLKTLSYDKQKFITDRMSGREKAFFMARKNQISTETFTGMYHKYYDISNNESLSSNQKAKEWSYAVDKAKEQGKLNWQGADLMKSALKFSSGFAVDDGKYGDMVGEGIAADIASAAYDAIAKIQGTGSVNAETGKATVRDIDKRSAIANLPYSDAQIDAIMHAYMPDYNPNASSVDRTELKYDYIRNELGYSPQQYTAAYYAYLDNTGKWNKINAIKKALGISASDASALYRVYSGAKKLP